MKNQYTDIELERKIEDLKEKIRSWAKKYDLWHDCSFSSWIKSYDDEPLESPCILLLISEETFYMALNEGDDEIIEEFDNLILNETDFIYEFDDHIVMSFWLNEKNKDLSDAYKKYFEWRWVCELIQPDFSGIYEEIYQRFEENPSDLKRLSPRQFEQLLDGIFKNNGYRSQLGPGQGDGGVDLRLYSEDSIGDTITLVQAKRYSNNPIRLEAVQALSAVVEDEKANRGLFVTTSRYLPGAKEFAARQNKKIILATSKEVQEWAGFAKQKIIHDKLKLIEPSYIADILNKKTNRGILGKIFYTSQGYNATYCSFAIVLKESKGAVLMMSIPSTVHTHDGYGQIGTHLPNTNISQLIKEQIVFRAKKRTYGNEISLWGNTNLYFLWDGRPMPFNYMD